MSQDDRGFEGAQVDRRLAQASAILRTRLGPAQWERLHPWSRSALVTSQLLYEILEAVDAPLQIERDLNLVAKTRTTAPEVDFSPVVLGMFKAIEIEIERKILGPFRNIAPSLVSRAERDAIQPTYELTCLARYVSNERSPIGLRTFTLLMAQLGNRTTPSSELARVLRNWMRAHLVRPDRLWGPRRLAHRLLDASVEYRNKAAHTKRFTPFETRTVTETLWGRSWRDGLLPATLRAIEERPIPGSKLDRDAGEIGGLTIERAILLRARHWIVEAVDEDTLDRYLLSLVPFDFALSDPLKEAFRQRRDAVKHPCLVRLSRWFQAHPRWGLRTAIASYLDGRPQVRPRKSTWRLGDEDCVRLAHSLAGATSALHGVGLVHGFISPHVVVRSSDGGWLLGGQALLLLVQRDSPIYVYPRVVAPEVNLLDARTLTPAADVFAIAATICCLREGQSARNLRPPTQVDVEHLFPDGPFRAILSQAMSERPERRPPDAIQLLAALEGRAIDRRERLRDEPSAVVISYSRADNVEAAQLIADLAAQGIRAWRDTEMIPGGAVWRKAIIEAIDACQAVIFLASSSSVRSKQVPKELDIAAEANKTVVPIFLEDIKPVDEFRYLLAGTHRLSFFDKSREEGLKELIRALTMLGINARSPSD